MNPSSTSPAAELVVIDDDPTDLLLLRELLDHGNAVGMVLSEASTLEAGAALIGAQTLCVVIDNVLPDGLGIELIAQLRAQWPALAIVMTTGSGDELTSVDALKAGANDYLPKAQMSPGRLQKAILEAVDKVQLATAVRRKHQQMALLEEMTDAADDLLFVVDCQQETLIHGNAATRRALGRVEASLSELPSPVSSLFKNGYASWVSLRALLAKNSPSRYETVIWAGKYTARPVEISARLIFKGSHSYVVGIARDITEQRRLQADLLELRGTEDSPSHDRG